MPDGPDTYLHGHHDSVLRSHRWRTPENSAGYLLGRLPAAADILDVGCGPGTITIGLAGLVGAGQVVGIDAARDVLAEARLEAERQARSNVRFEVGDVYNLAFGDASFDVVHAHQVLQHLSDPVAALTEMRRVCRDGGIVAARDSDYGGMIWFPEDQELAEWRRLYQQVARAIGGEPDAGRHLLSWARAAGFAKVEASASAWCYAGLQDRSWWGTLWAERLTSSSFGDRAVEHGLATRSDLDRLAKAWLRWAASEDGWFLIPHGEILCAAALFRRRRWLRLRPDRAATPERRNSARGLKRLARARRAVQAQALQVVAPVVVVDAVIVILEFHGVLLPEPHLGTPVVEPGEFEPEVAVLPGLVTRDASPAQVAAIVETGDLHDRAEFRIEYPVHLYADGRRCRPDLGCPPALHRARLSEGGPHRRGRGVQVENMMNSFHWFTAFDDSDNAVL